MFHVKIFRANERWDYLHKIEALPRGIENISTFSKEFFVTANMLPRVFLPRSPRITRVHFVRHIYDKQSLVITDIRVISEKLSRDFAVRYRSSTEEYFSRIFIAE